MSQRVIKNKLQKMYSSNVYIGNAIDFTDKLSELISNFVKDFLGYRLIFKSQF